MFEIKSFKPRLYQETILHSCVHKNTLVILPTGLGKTKLAILALIQRLNNFPQSKALFLTVTKPLASQIYNEIKESTSIPEEKIVLFTGEVKPELREKMWDDAKVIISTPQALANDVINQRIMLKNISTMVLDEVHNCVGDYDYVFLSKQYMKQGDYPRIIGLTASPGSNSEQIKTICNNSYAEEIELRTYEDEDVKPYVQEVDINYLEVELTEDLKVVQQYLNDCMKIRLKQLDDVGLKYQGSNPSKKQLLDIQKELQRRIITGEKDPLTWRCVSLVAEVLKVQHAQELLETQGISALNEYVKKIQTEAKKGKVKATKAVAEDNNFRAAGVKTELLFERGIEHPKLTKLKEIISEQIKKCEKIIVFNQYRDSASKIVNELNKLEGVKAKLFVGQAKKKGSGLSQKKQIEMLEQFRSNEFNVIVMTSVGEQGLDIPTVDLVIFYEPIPSAIRTIQRRGRTARHSKGEINILVTKGTRDEAFRWSAFHKENKMYSVLRNMKNKIKLEAPINKTLEDYKDPGVNLIIDSREKASGIVHIFKDKEVNIKLQNLICGDIIVSDRVGIERKAVKDFVDSIIDKRLLSQVKELKNNFERPLIIVEGMEDIYSVRKVHPNAIRGMLAAIIVGFGVPIINTKDTKDTVELVLSIAKREQNKDSKEISLLSERKPLTTKELQEYIVEGFPGVGPSLAKSLLKEFRCVKNIVNADSNELKDVEKIGKKKAEEIQRILNEDYNE